MRMSSLQKLWGLAAILFVGWAPSASAETALWSAGTAYTLPEGRAEIGIFQPLRYGIDDEIEISTAPLLSLLLPSVTVKYALPSAGSVAFAFEQSLSYPTPLLRLLAKEGTGGVWPANASIPHMMAFESALLTTWAAHPMLWLTLRTSLRYAATFGEEDWETADLPLVYTRTAAYHDHVALQLGVDVDGVIAGPLVYLIDVDLFLMPHRDAGYAIEHALLLGVRFSDVYLLQAGYKFVYGAYPFGADWHMLPLLDFVMAWGGASP